MLKAHIKRSLILFIILLITAISLIFIGLFSFNRPTVNNLKLNNQSTNLIANQPSDQIIRRYSLDTIRWNANANFSSSPTKDGGLLVITTDGGLEKIDSFGYLRWKLNLRDINALAVVDDNLNLVYSENRVVTKPLDPVFLNSVSKKVIAEAIQSQEDPTIYYLLAVSDQILDNDVKDQLFSFEQLATDLSSQAVVLKVKEDPTQISEPVGIIDYATISPTDLTQNYPASWKTNTLSLYGDNGSFRKSDHPSWFNNNSNFISLPWLQYITNLANLYEYQDNVFIFGGNGNWINDDQSDRKQATKYLSIGVFRIRFHKDLNTRPTVTGYPYAYLLSSLTSNDPDTQRLLLGQNTNYTLVPRIAVGGVKQGLGKNKNSVFLFGSITTGLNNTDDANQVVLDVPNYTNEELAKLNTLSPIPLSANDAVRNSVGPRAIIGLFFNLDDLINLPDLIDQANISSTYYLNQNSYPFRLIAPWTTTVAQHDVDALNISNQSKSITGTLYNLTIRHGFKENDIGSLIQLDDSSYGVAVGPYIIRIYLPSLERLIADKPNWLYRLSKIDFINYDINSPLNFNPIFSFKDFRGLGVVHSNKSYFFSLFAPNSLITTTPKLYYSDFSDKFKANPNFDIIMIPKTNGILQFANHDGLALQNDDFSFHLYSVNNDDLQDNGIINPVIQRVKFLGSGNFNQTKQLDLISTSLNDLFELQDNETILKPDRIKAIYNYFPVDNNQDYQLKLKVINLDYDQGTFRLVPYVFNKQTNDYQIIPDRSNGLTTDSSFLSFKRSIGIQEIYLYIGIGIPILILLVSLGLMAIVGMALSRERKRLIRSFRTNNLKVDSLVLSIGSVFKSLIHSSKRFKRLLSNENEQKEQKQAMQNVLNKTNTMNNSTSTNYPTQPFNQNQNDQARVNFSNLREYKAKTKMFSDDNIK